jgi:PAS domain S-box-containing protein
MNKRCFRIRYYETRKFPVELAEGKKGIGAYIRDITERKQAEEKEMQYLVRLSYLSKFANDFIILLDDNFHFLETNERVQEFYGYTRDELIGMHATDLRTPETKAAFEEQISGVIKTGKGLYETVHQRKDGTKFKVEVNLRAIDLEGKRLYQAIIRDITERKRAEEALRESERQYRNLFENSLEGIYQTTPEGRLISVNMALARMFGYEFPKEIVGAVMDISSELYVNPDEREKAINTLREKGYLKDFECQMRRKDGTTFWALINVRFTESQEGMCYLEGFIIDITDRKLAEKEILRLNAELEKDVTARTKELHDSQLALLNLVDDLNQSAKNIALALQTLEATNKELEAFSYSVSHDLRAPLRGMDGFSQTLLEDYGDKLDATGKNYLERIRAGTQRMGSLIDDMLKLSQVTRVEFKRESVDLSKMVRTILLTVRRNNPARDVKVSIQKDIIIDGDRHLLEIALTNLIDNAWKFTGKTKNARIEFGTLLKDGKPVIFIRDNGVGFDMAYVDKLFGAFQRLHTTAEFPGTGIGLATVQRVIHRHGGKIWAEGKVGKGAVFYFTLP